MSHHASACFGTILLRCCVAGAAVLFCAAGMACAPHPSPVRPPIDNMRVFNEPFEKVWSGMLLSVTTGEETLSLVDKSTGIMTFQRVIPVKMLDTYAFDESGMLISSATANVVVRITAENPRRTKILMNTKITATGKDVLDVLLSRQRQIVLDSKGWLEREYFERLVRVLTDIRAGNPSGVQ